MFWLGLCVGTVVGLFVAMLIRVLLDAVFGMRA